MVITPIFVFSAYYKKLIVTIYDLKPIHYYVHLYLNKNVMNKSAILSTIGFFFFIIGFLSIVLYLVGIKLSFLVWMDYWGRGTGLVLRLIMLLAGFILTFIGKSSEIKN